MFNRRDFLSLALTSAAGAALERVGGGQASKSHLRVTFVGGTLFKSLEDNSGAYLAVQPRGDDQHMPHRAFLAAPKSLKLPTSGGTIEYVKLPSDFPLERFLPGVEDVGNYALHCLRGATVRIHGAGKVTFEAKRVANYTERLKNWIPLDWTDSNKPIRSVINSRFLLQGGTISDGTAVNPAAQFDWKIENTNADPEPISDVTHYDVENPSVEIGERKLLRLPLPKGITRVFVLGGPTEEPAGISVYDRLTHPRVLRALYENTDNDSVDLVPVPSRKLLRVNPKVPHPCDIGSKKPQEIVPPDSELCVNYCQGCP